MDGSYRDAALPIDDMNLSGATRASTLDGADALASHSPPRRDGRAGKRQRLVQGNEENLALFTFANIIPFLIIDALHNDSRTIIGLEAEDRVAKLHTSHVYSSASSPKLQNDLTKRKLYSVNFNRS